MREIPLHQRENHCFISYASEDAEIALRLGKWLGSAGLRVWLDQLRLKAGSHVLDELTRQIFNSRACLLVVTEKTLTKHYVRHEVEIACDQATTCPGFILAAARTDPKLDLSEQFPTLRKLSWLQLPNWELNLETARRLLLSVTAPAPMVSGVRHAFVSCGWGENERNVTLRVCQPLAQRRVRLIGDAQDQQSFGGDGKNRVERIMSGCTGHLMVLPKRSSAAKTPEETYKYFLAEWTISRRLGLARRVFCVSRAVLPPQLQAEAIEIGTADDLKVFEPELVQFHDELDAVAPYVFLATDYKHEIERNAAAREIVEHVLGMDCRLGRDYPTAQLREAIVDKLVGANMVFADLACARDEHTNRLRLNLNTCIEAGIAVGARRPVFVTALDPESFDADVQSKTTQVPFMFRNNQVHWYSDSVDFLAKAHRLALATRRRILNDELQAVQPL